MSASSHADYESAGVDYGILDAAKRSAMAAALQTSTNAARLGATVDDRSRGESAVVVCVGQERLGFVLECLGTKSMIASRYLVETGIDRFDAIGYDTVAAVVNDCCCVGALPFVVNAYFATGAAGFYTGSRHTSLVAGFRRGCDDAGAVWGGGESPTLAGLIDPEEIDLAGSAVGRIPSGIDPIFGERLGEGDEIVIISSSGLHANGASLVRMVADELPNGLSTPLGSGRSFGEAILDPALIYVRLVEALINASIEIHYLSHITGHGLRKLMRADVDLTYCLRELPEVPEALSFLVSAAGLSAREAYGTLNMGAGLAVYVPAGMGEHVVSVAGANGLHALVAGVVMNGSRAVVLEPVGVSFTGDELELR